MHVSPFALGHEINRVDSAELILAQRVFGSRGTSGIQGPVGPTGATGLSGGAMVKIGKVICSGSQSTISFLSIPNTYTDLIVTFSGRAAGAVGTTNCYLKINNDGTSSNYRGSQYLAGHGSVVATSSQASTSSGALVFFIAGTLNTSHPITAGQISIPNYSGSVVEKSFSSTMQVEYDSTTSGESELITGHWLSTAIISRLDLIASSGSFLDGSVATLYGLG